MRFELLEPDSVEEAVSLLNEHREEAKVIAAGQSLVLMLRCGVVRPAFLVALNKRLALDDVSETSEGNLRIGALATHRQIQASRVVQRKAAVLAQAVSLIGSTPVRNFGTLGGNLCHNEMGGDPPPALLVLDAAAECLSPRGKRKIPLTDFFKDYFETCLEPDEILLGVEIPPPPLGMKGVYLKHTLRSGDLAIVGVAVQLAMKDDFCQEIRIALGGVAPVPFRALEAEALLRQRLLSDHLIGGAAAAAADMSDPISDAHASADYRRSMVQVFVRRALQRTLRGGARELARIIHGPRKDPDRL